MEKPKISKEILFHFSCEKCYKWWSIGDAPEEKEIWFCPWCGFKNIFSAKPSSVSTTLVGVSVKNENSLLKCNSCTIELYEKT